MSKFPQKQQNNNKDKFDDLLDEVGKDLTIDNTPLDFNSNTTNKSDPNLDLIFNDARKHTIYIYKLQNLIKNKNRPVFKSSSNSVKIGFVDTADFLKTTAYETSDFNLQLSAQPSTNPNDKSTLYSMLDTKVMIFQEVDLLNEYNLHVISLDNPLSNQNIDDLYIVDQYNQPWSFKEIRTTKLTNLTRLKDYKTRDGNSIVVNLQKPLPADTTVNKIKIKAPKTMKWGNIKVWGEVNGIYGYPKLNVVNKTPFPLLSMPIQTQPNVRVLQQWFSKQILPWNLAKQFITTDDNAISCLDLIKLGNITPDTRKLVIKNARVTSAKIKVDCLYSNYDAVAQACIDQQVVKEEEIIGLNLRFSGQCIQLANFKITDTYNDVELEIKDAPNIYSLQKVLLDMLTYTYNYNRNFNDAKYVDGSPKNKTAKLKAKFDGQKPEVVISNLFEQWKLDNPDYINDEKVQIFRELVFLLSKDIYSNQSVNKGLNDDIKLLSPYYLRLVSKPESEPDPDDGNYYEFKDVKVILESKYFKFNYDNPSDIKIQNYDIANNELFKLDDNQFNWLSITNNLETNDIPSLIPADMTLASGEFGKYFTRIVIDNSKIENMLALYSTDNNLFSKFEWLELVDHIVDNDFTEFELSKPLTNLDRLELTGIDAFGNYDLLIETSNGNININAVELFSNTDETVSLIDINF